MRSKWFKLKSKAISFRREGKSLRDVESYLDIPRSTLSYWFKNIKLTPLQYKLLENRHKKSLTKARKEAVVWHNQQKIHRIQLAAEEAEKTLSKIKTKKEIIELGLALLYLGEGSKKSRQFNT